MAGKKKDEGKKSDTGKAAKGGGAKGGKATASKDAGDKASTAKGAQSINVRHILVRIHPPSSPLLQSPFHLHQDGLHAPHALPLPPSQI